MLTVSGASVTVTSRSRVSLTSVMAGPKSFGLAIAGCRLAENEGVTECLKANNQMEWMQRMNSIRNRATEIANAELIYTA